MALFNGLPIFNINVDDPSNTITTISLVDCPAMELPMYTFSDDKEVKMVFAQEDQHNIISCIVRVDYPIYRLAANGQGYYIVFGKDAAKKLCQKLMTDGFQQNISLDHNGKLIDGIQLQEVFIKDVERGINPQGFDDAPDGSLFGIYHITDEALWQDCLEGKFGGVSLESYLKLEEFKSIKKSNNRKMSKLRKAIESLLLQFSEVETDKGVLEYSADELAVGVEVTIDGEPAADGEYVAGEQIIVVADGKVAEIREVKPEEPETPAEPVKPAEPETPAQAEEETPAEPEKPAEPETPAEPEYDAKAEIAALTARVDELATKIDEAIAKIAEISAQPAAAPAEEEFNNVKIDKKSNKMANIFSHKND